MKSELEKVTFVVPQGSVVGPKLFILYINDLCTVSNVLQFVNFADDTTLFCSGKKLEELLNTVEEELKKLKIWFDINKLSLNVSKTKFIVFGNRKLHDEVTLKIDDVEIERVAENKFLGVIIDKKLNWKTHIKYIKSKISKSIAILHKTKHILDQRSLHMLYSSLITPYLTYCAELWGNTYKTNTNCIVLLQKRAIRIVNGVDYIHPTNLLFANSRSLKFKDLVELKTLEILFRAKSKTLPDCIQGLFSMRESRYLLRGA